MDQMIYDLLQNMNVKMATMEEEILKLKAKNSPEPVQEKVNSFDQPDIEIKSVGIKPKASKRVMRQQNNLPQ